MKNLLYSKTVAWLALCLVVIIIIFTFTIRPVWWTFIDEFFAFMMVFTQLMALYIIKTSVYAAKKLQLCAAVFGILMILALIGEFIAYQVIYS